MGPNGTNEAGDPRLTAWQEYVSLHMKSMREYNTNTSMKICMRRLAACFRAEQAHESEGEKDGYFVMEPGVMPAE